MKILFITTNVKQGGAAVGARNLIKSLRDNGHEVIVIDKHSVTGLKSNLLIFVRIIERLIEKIFINSEDAHFIKLGLSTIDLISEVNYHKPDIVQFGFIAGNIISFKDITRITVPVVMRVSDSWPFAGSFHYFEEGKEAQGLRDKCITWLFNMFYDLSFLKNVHVVAPSHWLASIIDKEGVLESSVKYIPNAVEKSYKKFPLKKQEQVCNRILMFISKDLNDPRKGMNMFLSFLDLVANTEDQNWKVYLVGGGAKKNKLSKISKKIEIISLGLQDKNALKGIFRKVSYLVCPSIMDNSPNVVTEAFSHGIPVIINSGTGTSSYLDEGKSGIEHDFTNLSKNNIELFSRKINDYDIEKMGKYAYTKSKSDYSFNVIGRLYSDLYEQLSIKGLDSCKDGF